MVLGPSLKKNKKNTLYLCIEFIDLCVLRFSNTFTIISPAGPTQLPCILIFYKFVEDGDNMSGKEEVEIVLYDEV